MSSTPKDYKGNDWAADPRAIFDGGSAGLCAADWKCPDCGKTVSRMLRHSCPWDDRVREIVLEALEEYFKKEPPKC